MSKTQYDIYLDDTFRLTRSLVIKSEAAADAINTGLQEQGVAVDTLDPASWKYYLNLNGQYHATDTMMYVSSLDTLQTIAFTRQNLQVHTATARAYRSFDSYFDRLVSQYPAQESLVRGILNPVEIDRAQAAADGDILYYRRDLVGVQETQLIPALQTWLTNFMFRWNVGGFTLTDDLYAAAQWAVMIQQIPMVLMNLRLEACHTPYVHEFHMREYLTSHGRLDRYFDYLTLAQKLWLYRNVRYIERNIGQQDTFRWLTANILTARGLPLGEWDAVHNIAQMPEALYPGVEFRRTDIALSNYGDAIIDVVQMLNKEVGAARSNALVQNDFEDSIQTAVETAPVSFMKTKVLESATVDRTDSQPYRKSDMLLNLWLDLARRNVYKATLVVTNPKSGAPLSLGVLDAFVAWLYCFNAGYGMVLPTVPKVYAHNVPRPVLPSFAQIRARVAVKDVPDASIYALLQAQASIPLEINDTALFYTTAMGVYEGLMAQWFGWATRELALERVGTEIAAMQLYHTPSIDLAGGMTYADWFEARELDIGTYNEVEHRALAHVLLQAATGLDSGNVVTLKMIQEAMLNIMRQFSSYGVQYIGTMNDLPILTESDCGVRVVDVREQEHRNVRAGVNLELGIVHDHSHAYARHFLDLDDVGLKYTVRGREHRHLTVHQGIRPLGGVMVRARKQVRIAPVDVLEEAEEAGQ